MAVFQNGWSLVMIWPCWLFESFCFHQFNTYPFRCHCCTQYRKLYRSLYLHSQILFKYLPAAKNAAIETMFSAPLAIPHPAICHINITKNFQKCIFLPQCVFIIRWMLRTVYKGNDVKSISDTKWQVRCCSIWLYNQIDDASICCLCNSIFLISKMWDFSLAYSSVIWPVFHNFLLLLEI